MPLNKAERDHISQRRINYSAQIVPKAAHEIDLLESVIRHNRLYIIRQEEELQALAESVLAWWDEANDGQVVPEFVIRAEAAMRDHPHPPEGGAA